MPKDDHQNRPIVFYDGNVMHARMRPILHRFNYRMCSILIDLDNLNAANSVSALFSVDKWNMCSFQSRDHGLYDNGIAVKGTLRSQVEYLLKQVGLGSPKNIQLLCYPRVLGYGFNPVSVYFCRNEAGEPTALLYEVRNTFGERHTYVQPVMAHQLSPAGIRQEANKLLYVSPFMPMKMKYLFRVRMPDEKLVFRILETDQDGPVLAASFSGVRKWVSAWTILKLLLQTAGITWKVTAGIHFEALRLWIKGMKIVPRKPHKLSYSLPVEICDRPELETGSPKHRRHEADGR